MALTAAQLGSCFQTYWYMWLTNGVSGLLFMGIQIGIAAFFLKKLAKKKAAARRHLPKRVPSTKGGRTQVDITTFDDPYGNGPREAVSPTDINAFEQPYPHSSTERFLVGTPDTRNGSGASARVPGISEDNDDFAQSTLQTLNGTRYQYRSPPLELNDDLSQMAQQWAEHMARNGKLEHSPREQRTFEGQVLGENYAASFQAELTGEKMVKKWLKEGKRYMFGYDGRLDTQNFTQLVWRSSQEVGIGRARSEDGNWWYGVVVFHPPGNIPNEYANNVFLPPA